MKPRIELGLGSPNGLNVSVSVIDGGGMRNWQNGTVLATAKYFLYRWLKELGIHQEESC